MKYLFLLLISLNAFAVDTTIYGRLKVSSTTKASQPCPVMTNAQMLSIASPQQGDCVFNSTENSNYIWDYLGTEWVASGSGGGISEWETASNYKVGAIVHINGIIYKCLSLHTSGTFATDLASNLWIAISDELLSKNQIDSTSSAIKEIQVPHKQFTPTASGKVLQETGNKNRLENPGFEATTVNSGWTSNVTSTAVATISTESAAPIEGKKSLIYSCAGGASGGTCTLSQDVATAYALQGLASIFIESDSATGVKLFNRVNATNSLSIPVDTITASIRKIPFVLGTTSSGLAVEITVAAAQTIEVLLDEAFVGAQDVKQDTDSSRIAGESYFAGTTSCSWSRTSTTIGAFTATAACPGPTVVDGSMGSWQTTDSDLPRQTVNNLPAGKYKATFIAPSNMSVAAFAGLAINDGSTTCEPVNGNNSASIIVGTPVSCTFNYTSSGNRVFELYGASSANTLSIGNSSTAPRVSMKFQLEYFGSGSVYSSTNADTDWAACNFSTLAWQGLGTVTHELKCKRQGGDLLMTGRVNIGAVSASEARFLLPTWNGSQLTTKTNLSTFPFAGRSARNALTQNDYSMLLVSGQSYLNYSLFNNASVPPHAAQAGTILGSSDVLFFEQLRIPINGWENSNVTIASFAEIPTTRGSNGADIQSVLFGSGAGCQTVCSTGTCSICTRVGSKITSVTWISTGNYNVNGIDGTKYICNGNGVGTNYTSAYHRLDTSDATMARVIYGYQSATQNVGAASVTCIGIP